MNNSSLYVNNAPNFSLYVINAPLCKYINIRSSLYVNNASNFPLCVINAPLCKASLLSGTLPGLSQLTRMQTLCVLSFLGWPTMLILLFGRAIDDTWVSGSLPAGLSGLSLIKELCVSPLFPLSPPCAGWIVRPLPDQRTVSLSILSSGSLMHNSSTLASPFAVTLAPVAVPFHVRHSNAFNMSGLIEPATFLFFLAAVLCA